MITKAITSARSADDALPPVWRTTPLDSDECRQRIAMLGRRITGYIDFMCQTTGPEIASAEAREKAVAAFYEKLLFVERQLARIHDAFRLV
ncbi:MAG: hypothetical protein L0Y71_18730 [Gemmataceae bacterium]|nr:hypothetical protein [Gemmataceae bacterium]